MTAFVSWGIALATAVAPGAVSDVAYAARADRTAVTPFASDTIGLAATPSAPGAKGYVRLTHAPSPFTVAVGVDGPLVYDLAIETTGLLDPAPLGGKVYIAWVASRALDRYERIGVLDSHTRIDGRTAMDKFLVVITAEPSADAVAPAGPIVMHGMSPSGKLQSFQGHELFNGPVVGDEALEAAAIASYVLASAPLRVRYTLADGRTAERTAEWR
jgi:hypothetical protein